MTNEPRQEQEHAAMLAAARAMLRADPDKLAGEALGLAGLCVAILTALFLPALA